MKKRAILLIALMAVSAVLIPAKAHATNLAFLAPVTVNSYYSIFDGSRATDGNYNSLAPDYSYWNAGDHGYSSPLAAQNWLYADLGAIFNVNRIKLVGGYNGPQGQNQWYGYKNFFRVSISSDTLTWTDLYDGMLTDTETGRFDDRTFSPLTARYVRYLEVGGDYLGTTEDDPGIHWSVLAEMEVYAVNNVIPEPASLSLFGLGLLGLFRKLKRQNSKRKTLI